MRTFGQCCASLAGERALPSAIKVVNDFISPQQRRQLVAFAEKQKRKWLTVVGNKKTVDGQRILKRHPNRVTERVQLSSMQREVSSWFEKGCREYLSASTVPPQWYETPQLLRYGLGGKYGMHSDADSFCSEQQRFYRFIDRDFSMLIYLNDDYVGGELEFKGLNFRYQPKAGDLVIFPSNHIFSHESLPIISGTKYALVTWGVFEGSPRVSSPRQTVSLQ